jgi:hypothetical protein
MQASHSLAWLAQLQNTAAALARLSVLLLLMLPALLLSPLLAMFGHSCLLLRLAVAAEASTALV